MHLILYDPVEDTDCVATRTPLGVKDEYKAIVDEIEALLDEKYPIKGYPSRDIGRYRMYYKKHLLKERGIDWKTIIELNPSHIISI